MYRIHKLEEKIFNKEAKLTPTKLDFSNLIISNNLLEKYSFTLNPFFCKTANVVILVTNFLNQNNYSFYH